MKLLLLLTVFLISCGIQNQNNMIVKKSIKESLSKISEKAIELSDFEYTQEQQNLKWIGYPPATEQQIKNLERRLKIQLPKDFKEFLRITNGFDAPCSVEPSFCNIEMIDFLTNVDSELVEIWAETGNIDKANSMKSAIKVGGFNEEQYFFLIPPNGQNDNWEYWKFATWIPGEEVYKTFLDYLSAVYKTTENFVND